MPKEFRWQYHCAWEAWEQRDHPGSCATPRGRVRHPSTTGARRAPPHRRGEPEHRLVAGVVAHRLAAAAVVARIRPEHCKQAAVAAAAVAEEAEPHTSWKEAKPERTPLPRSRTGTSGLLVAGSTAALVAGSTGEPGVVAHKEQGLAHTDTRAEHWYTTWCQMPGKGVRHPWTTSLH